MDNSWVSCFLDHSVNQCQQWSMYSFMTNHSPYFTFSHHHLILELDGCCNSSHFGMVRMLENCLVHAFGEYNGVLLYLAFTTLLQNCYSSPPSLTFIPAMRGGEIIWNDPVRFVRKSHSKQWNETAFLCHCNRPFGLSYVTECIIIHILPVLHGRFVSNVNVTVFATTATLYRKYLYLREYDRYRYNFNQGELAQSVSKWL